MRSPFITQPNRFSPALRTIPEHLVLLLSGKAVVLPIKITFKRIDSAILKLTLCFLKIIVVWNIYAIKRAY